MYEYKTKFGATLISEVPLSKGDVFKIGDDYCYIESITNDNIIEIEDYEIPYVRVEF